jgi:bacillithiol biosynthesis cysteine-adding enzyme BshC
MESQCITFREIPHTTKLFSTFLEDFNRVSSYFAHPPTLAGVAAAASEVHLEPAARRDLVAVLREENAAFLGGSMDPETSRNLDRMLSGAVAIVTGQQVGLFSGPVYSIYKALSAVRCAEEMTRRGTDAVPVFWLATEDHDLAEINHCEWNTRTGLAHYELPSNEREVGRRVGEIVLGDEIESLVGTAIESLDGPFAEDVGRALRESYKPGETYGSAYGKLMARLMAGRGIIFVDPLDARLHRLAAPTFHRALDQSESLREELLSRSNELDRGGFHAQVKVTRETTLLFYNIDGRREPLRSRNGKFTAGDSTFSSEELHAAIDRAPESFTANALLRPVVQDTLFPTAAYIGGPAEIAYMAQAQVAYEKILGRMPAILPRSSFTIVEPPIARFLQKYGLAIRDLIDNQRTLRGKMEEKSLPAELSNRFEADEVALQRLLNGYVEPLERLDRTLLGALKLSERNILHLFEKLKAKVARAESFRVGVLGRHEQILVDSLYPHGGLQERTLCGLPLLATYGTELLDELSRFSCPPDSSASLPAGSAPCAFQHHVLFL